MDVVPAPTIVTQPELSTVATDVSVEYQIPAPSGTLLTNKKLFPTRSKFCTGGSMVSFFAVVVVVAAVAGHEGADLVPAFLHCLRQRTAKPGTLRFWKIGGDLLTHVQNFACHGFEGLYLQR